MTRHSYAGCIPTSSSTDCPLADDSRSPSASRSRACTPASSSFTAATLVEAPSPLPRSADISSSLRAFRPLSGLFSRCKGSCGLTRAAVVLWLPGWLCCCLRMRTWAAMCCTSEAVSAARSSTADSLSAWVGSSALDDACCKAAAASRWGDDPCASAALSWLPQLLLLWSEEDSPSLAMGSPKTLPESLLHLSFMTAVDSSRAGHVSTEGRPSEGAAGAAGMSKVSPAMATSGGSSKLSLVIAACLADVSHLTATRLINTASMYQVK